MNRDEFKAGVKASGYLFGVKRTKLLIFEKVEPLPYQSRPIVASISEDAVGQFEIFSKIDDSLLLAINHYARTPLEARKQKMYVWYPDMNGFRTYIGASSNRCENISPIFEVKVQSSSELPERYPYKLDEFLFDRVKFESLPKQWRDSGLLVKEQVVYNKDK